MSNYTKTTDFEAKDSLPSGDSGKIIRGSEFETEFDNIATAIASKSDANNPTFTGTVTIDGLTVNGNTVLGNAASDTVTVTADIASNLLPSADDTYNLGAVGAEWNDLYVDGVAYIDTINGFAATGDVNFGDNNKAQFGAGSDLQIYHDGNDSYITDSGTGNLRIRGTDITLQDASGNGFISMVDNGTAGTVYIKHNGSNVLTTTSTGIDVTGTVTADDVKSDLFGAADGSETNPSIRNTGDSNTGFWFPDADTIGVSTGGIERMRVNSTGVDVTGTATMDRANVGTSTVNYTGTDLTVGDNSDSQNGLAIQTSTSGIGYILFGDGSGASAYRGEINYSHATDSLTFKTAGSARLNIGSNGDISFYEDTGTTAKFFWDASAESLAIGQSNNFSNALANDLQVGTTSGSHGITIVGQNTASANLFFADNNNNDRGKISYSHASDALSFTVASTERMRIDSSGNVGIGTSSPSNALEVSEGGGGNTVARFTNSAQANSFIQFNDTASTVRPRIGSAGNNLILDTANTERMRLDSSGNLFVSKTASSLATVGSQLQATGLIRATTDGSDVLQLNRKTSDGTIAAFYKDGSTVGSIGTSNSRLHIGNGDVGLLIAGDLDNITPWNSTTGASRDAAVDLGNSGVRFKDLYLSGGAYLGGTAAANKLDDYEEGTFTPTASNAQGFTLGTPTGANGSYTKIGRTVNLKCGFTSLDSTEVIAVGDRFEISGIPFNTSGNYTAATASAGSCFIYNSFGGGALATGSVTHSGSILIVFIDSVLGSPTFSNDFNIGLVYESA